MANQLQARQILQGVGGSNGEMFENQETHVRDTVFIAPSASLTDLDFFGSDAKDPMWKTKDFPSGTQAFNITNIFVDAQITFDDNAVENVAKLHYFLKNSFLEIRNEGSDVVKLPLSECVDYKKVPTTKSDVNSGVINRYNDFESKFNNTYALKKPLVVAANEKPDVKIIVAKGLTSAAYSANYCPFLYNHGASHISSNQGFYIMVDFKGIKSKANA